MKTTIIDGIEYKLVPIEGPIYTHEGLMWTKTFEKMIWKKAMDFCTQLEYAGHNDWRLPTIKELMSIVDFEKHDPACYIAESLISGYWSSITYAGSAVNAWRVDLYNGNLNARNKSYSYYVRAVRDMKG